MSEQPATYRPPTDHVTMIPPAGEPVDWTSITGEARLQAGGLAGTGPVLNLCEDRLAFLVLLLAAALADRETILPSDRSPGGLLGARSSYKSATVRYDSKDMARRVSPSGRKTRSPD